MKVLLCVCLALLGVVRGSDDLLGGAVQVARQHAEVFEAQLTKAGHGKVGQQMTRALQQGENCDLCQDVMSTLKELAVDISFPDVRDVVVDICVELLTARNPTTKASILCPGLIDLQGPHVFNVLKDARTNKDNLCRNLNQCFAPKQGEEIVDSDFFAPPEYLYPSKQQEEEQEAEDMDEGFFAPEDFNVKSAKRQDKKEDVVDEGFFAPEELVRSAKGQDVAKGPEKLQKADKKDLKIVHLADIHVDPFYAIGSPTDCGLTVCCHSDLQGTGKAGKFGDYNCNVPQRTVENILKEVRAMNPDFVFFTGDNPPHHIWKETRDIQLNSSTLVYESMARILADFRVFSAIGNHEFYPTNIYNPEQENSQMAVDNLVKLWRPLAKISGTEEETVKKGAYYSTLAKPGLRIISINTNFWYTFNWYNTINELRPAATEMKAFFANTLAKAKQNNEKVIVLYHHPPGTHDQMHTVSRWLSKLIRQYTDTIILQVAGHTHRDSYKIISANGKPVSMVYVEPSVTSRDSKGGIKPSVRVYTLDGETFKVKDYDQYRYDMFASTPSLKFAYNAKKEYNLDELTPESWFELTNKMSTDVELKKKWLLNNHAGVPVTCEEGCQTAKICGLRHSVWDDVLTCIDNLGMPVEPALYTNTAAVSSQSLGLAVASLVVALKAMW